MPFLQPIIMRDAYVRAIEDEIQHLFDEVLYLPLLRIAETPLREFTNAISGLIDAIQQGRVWYLDGFFYGSYNAKISLELRSIGAQYNHLKKAWALEQVFVPPPVKAALVIAESKITAMRRQMISVLGDAPLDRIDQQQAIKQRYDQIIERIDKDFTRTISAYDAIAIAPKLTDGMRDLISEEWGANLNLYIKGWAKENILKLREEIEPQILAGGRAESLRETIAQNYQVSKAKAKFLARQETGLLVAKFRESRYADIGIEEYQWRGAMDSRERPDHKKLEGEIFRFDSPPVTNLETGARNNPGEDWGCRCLAIPIAR